MKSIYDNYAVKDHETSNGLSSPTAPIQSILTLQYPATTAVWMNGNSWESIFIWEALTRLGQKDWEQILVKTAIMFLTFYTDEISCKTQFHPDLSEIEGLRNTVKFIINMNLLGVFLLSGNQSTSFRKYCSKERA